MTDKDFEKLVDDLDEQFKKWEKGKKGIDAKLAPPKEDFVKPNFTLGDDRKVEQLREAIYNNREWSKKLHMEFGFDGQWFPIESITTNKNGYGEITGEFYTRHHAAQFIASKDIFFDIRMVEGDKSKITMSKCKINVIDSGTTGDMTLYRIAFICMQAEYMQPMIREPIHTITRRNAGWHDIPEGRNVRPMSDGGIIGQDYSSISPFSLDLGGRVPGYYSTPRMYDEKWNPGGFPEGSHAKHLKAATADLTETVPEIACMLCGKTSKEIKVGNEFMRTCETPGCPNNIKDEIGKAITSGVNVKDMEVIAKNVHKLKINGPKLIFSVFSWIIAIIVIFIFIGQLMQVIK